MKKRLLILFCLCIFFITPHKVHASETSDNFQVDSKTTYKVSESGTTRVTQIISITNKKEFTYSPSYSLALHLKTISDISVSNANGSIPYKMQESKNDKIISLDFPEKIIGVGKKNEFTISFNSSDFAQNVGNIWEFTIPDLSKPDDFNTYAVTVSVPDSFGEPTILKPETSRSKNGSSYTFTKNELSLGGVTIYFGDTQVYQFNLLYHLDNSNLFPISTEIALPSKTSYQDVLINSVDPKPKNVYFDEDGNMLATFILSPKSSTVVKAEVTVRVKGFPAQDALDDSKMSKYLKPQKYWEVADSEIVKIAKDANTPEKIYSYVVKTLSYNYDKTSKENTRLGAKGVLSKPYFAVCLEFTDLFVAVARAAGIPARAVEGYAYTFDDSTRPVSLFKDILHAWPEYYNADKKTWIMVDPTWGNTTKGTDYFNTFDYDHVAFTVNGLNSTYPVPAGGYKSAEETKDISVAYISPDEYREKDGFGVSSYFSPFSQSARVEERITQENTGNHISSKQNYIVYVDNVRSQEVTFSPQPPFSSTEVGVSVKIPQHLSFINSLTNIEHTITIKNESGEIVSHSKVQVFPVSLNILIGGAIIFAAGIVFVIAFKTGGLPISRQRK